LKIPEYKLNPWPAVSDLMLTFFILALVVGILTAMVSVLKQRAPLAPNKGNTPAAATQGQWDKLQNLVTKLKDENSKLRAEIALASNQISQLEKANERIPLLEEEIARLTERIKSLEKVIQDQGGVIDDLTNEVNDFEKTSLKDKPRIWELPASRNYTFELGSAILSSEFKKACRTTLFPDFKRVLSDNPSMAVMEIVGHTDSVPVGSKGNFDREILAFLETNSGIDSFTGGSNADLGLMRALALRAEWLDWIVDRDVREHSVWCYSAASTIPPKGSKLSGTANRESRRIEVRFTQKGIEADSVKIPFR